MPTPDIRKFCVPKAKACVPQRDENVLDAVCEVQAFMRGGEPGVARLREVWPSIRKHYRIQNDAEVFRRAGARFHEYKNFIPGVWKGQKE